jgi:putative endonuclease
MPDMRGAFGLRGEDLACEELQRRGYAILDRRFRTRFGELDIVARDGHIIAFVEVRARSCGSFGTPFESVTWKKRQRLSHMATSYLMIRQLTGVACRFDVVSVIDSRAGLTIELLKGAFEVGT